MLHFLTSDTVLEKGRMDSRTLKKNGRETTLFCSTWLYVDLPLLLHLQSDLAKQWFSRCKNAFVVNAVFVEYPNVYLIE